MPPVNVHTSHSNTNILNVAFTSEIKIGMQILPNIFELLPFYKNKMELHPMSIFQSYSGILLIFKLLFKQT